MSVVRSIIEDAQGQALSHTQNSSRGHACRQAPAGMHWLTGVPLPQSVPAIVMRDQTRRRKNGQYDLGPQCYGCNKPAGEDYLSAGQTGCTDAQGAQWGDMALVLCPKCAKAVDQMTLVSQFIAYRAKRHPDFKGVDPG
jgi:hypothetical protein